MARKLKTWIHGLFSNYKQQLIMGLHVILQLDVVQKSHTLSPAKKAALKCRVMGLAVLEHACKRHASGLPTFMRAMQTPNSSTFM
jgi:hypothetical protein